MNSLCAEYSQKSRITETDEGYEMMKANVYMYLKVIVRIKGISNVQEKYFFPQIEG